METEDRELEALLRAAAQEERSTLEDARALEEAPGSELVAETLRRRFERDGRAPGRRWLPLAAAAVAIMLGFAARSWLRSPRPGPSGTLGGYELVLLAPVGASHDFRVFQWRETSAAAAWFEVLVARESPAGAGEPVASSGRLKTPSWSPDPKEILAWPERIHWEVRAFDASGALLDARSASAWRSP